LAAEIVKGGGCLVRLAATRSSNSQSVSLTLNDDVDRLMIEYTGFVMLGIEQTNDHVPSIAGIDAIGYRWLRDRAAPYRVANPTQLTLNAGRFYLALGFDKVGPIDVPMGQI
jgi:hypothetical protein